MSFTTLILVVVLLVLISGLSWWWYVTRDDKNKLADPTKSTKAGLLHPKVVAIVANITDAFKEDNDYSSKVTGVFKAPIPSHTPVIVHKGVELPSADFVHTIADA
jgi:hypothetical protein